MNTTTRSQVDEVLEEESHQGDTFAKVAVNDDTGWVLLEADQSTGDSNDE